MRFICTAVPGPSLFQSTVPLAWALRAAGHEVLLLNNGPAAHAAAHAGLPIVDPLPERDLWAEFLTAIAAQHPAGVVQPGGATPPNGGFGWFGEQMIEPMLAVAAAFRPDLVVSTLEQGAGPLLAAALGVPLVEHSIRMANAGADSHSTKHRGLIAEHLEPTRRRLGIGAVPPRATTIDMRPPSLGGSPADNQWLMRYIPYNESRIVPAWLTMPADRPRVCVTLGTVLPALGGVGVLRDILTDLSTLDVEIVLALGDVDLADLGTLPANVHATGWLPLASVLPTCAAILHHAGAASMATPLVYGVPQVAFPHFADQPRNAALVASCGAGLTIDAPGQAREALARVLSDAGFTGQAARIRDEIAAQPSPAEIVTRLAGLR
jgi:UDP:flavonoid glycosyltransferase YjiC (YdhE family)